MVDQAKVSDLPDRRGCYFKVELPEYDIMLDNTDVNALQAETYKLLDERLAVTWDPYLYLTIYGETKAVVPEAGHRQPTSTMTLLADYVELAGTKWRGRSGRFGRHVHDELPETGERHRGWVVGEKEVLSLVPDTPANREAVNILFSGLNDLKEALLKAMMPDRIQSFLDLLRESKGSILKFAFGEEDECATADHASAAKNPRRRRPPPVAVGQGERQAAGRADCGG
jgi:hypothetical protein